MTRARVQFDSAATAEAEAAARWCEERESGLGSDFLAELLKLGIDISQATVSKYIPRRRKPPSQTWRAFLESHVGTFLSVDFFTVPTVFFHVMFVFVVLAHDRRRILSINLTSNPSAAWTANQIMQAFPWDTRDRQGSRTSGCGRPAPSVHAQSRLIRPAGCATRGPRPALQCAVTLHPLRLRSLPARLDTA